METEQFIVIYSFIITPLRLSLVVIRAVRCMVAAIFGCRCPGYLYTLTLIPKKNRYTPSLSEQAPGSELSFQLSESLCPRLHITLLVAYYFGPTEHLLVQIAKLGQWLKSGNSTRLAYMI